jgi:tryptophanase
VNLFSSHLTEGQSDVRFKGNMNVSELKALLEKSHDRVPVVYLTLTNNTAGGQPVSMANIREVRQVTQHYDIPLFFDACRFAENAWFIKRFEHGYAEKEIEDIVREMFSYADGFTISFKKDGLVNMGGGLFIRNAGLFSNKYPNISNSILDYQILTEAHPTYGGLSGHDIMALVVGLRLVTRYAYLTYRIEQVREFGEEMHRQGIPVLRPIGGHAVYVDINKFFSGTSMQPDDFGGISLCAVLLAAYGHRGCELGYFSFGHYDDERKREIRPEMNFVRFAVPRLRYEKQDLDSVVAAMKILHEHRQDIPGVKVTYGRNLPLRHFKARFEFKK